MIEDLPLEAMHPEEIPEDLPAFSTPTIWELLQANQDKVWLSWKYRGYFELGEVIFISGGRRGAQVKI